MRRRLADLHIAVNRRKGFYLPGETVHARVTLTAHETFAIQRGWVALQSLRTYIKEICEIVSWVETSQGGYFDDIRSEVKYKEVIIKTQIKDELWTDASMDFLPQPCEIPAGLIQTFDIRFNLANEPGWATYDDEKLKLRWEVYAALQRGERELVSAALPITLLRPPHPDELHTPATFAKVLRHPKIRVTLPHSAYRLGTAVSGTAEVEFGERVKARRLEIVLKRDSSGGTFKYGSRTFHFDTRAARNNSFTFPFSFTLPSEWHFPTMSAKPLYCEWSIQAILEPSQHGASVMVPFTAYNYTPP